MKPDRASSYNNRAQAYRLAGKVSGIFRLLLPHFRQTHWFTNVLLSHSSTEAKADLDRAIDLTRGQGNVGSNALCQRALINYLNGQNEEALEDLKSAAEQGHPLASKLLVQLNPYAALCNQMLSQMIAQLSVCQ